MDPKKRLTAGGAVTHPWLLSKDTDLLNNNLGVNLEQLRLFNARRKLRAAIKSVSERTQADVGERCVCVCVFFACVSERRTRRGGRNIIVNILVFIVT